jgi:hypothetical protein
MSPLLLHTSKGLEVTVDSLMSPHCSTLCSGIRFRNNNITMTTGKVFVPPVGFHHLSRKQQVLQISSIDVDVRPSSCRIASTYPDYHPSLYTDSYLISKSRVPELVRVIHPVARVWCLSCNLEVGSIDSDLACTPAVAFASIIPSNLQHQERKQKVNWLGVPLNCCL